MELNLRTALCVVSVKSSVITQFYTWKDVLQICVMLRVGYLYDQKCDVKGL